MRLVVSAAICAASAWALVVATDLWVYLIALLIWSIAYLFSLPYFLGTAAALDSHGRWSAAMAGAMAVGAAIGPAAAGLLMSQWGYQGLGWLTVATGAVGLVLIIPVTLALDRKPDAAVSD